MMPKECIISTDIERMVKSRMNKDGSREAIQTMWDMLFNADVDVDGDAYDAMYYCEEMRNLFRKVASVPDAPSDLRSLLKEAIDAYAVAEEKLTEAFHKMEDVYREGKRLAKQ